MPIRILHLEDEAGFSTLVGSRFEAQGMDVAITRVQSEREFRDCLRAGSFDIVLADYALAGYDGLSALEAAARKRPALPFIFLSGTLGEEVAVESLKRGACDYVLKSSLARLVPAVERALAAGREASALRSAQEREERYRRLLEACPDSIFVVKDGVVTLANPAGLRLLGEGAEDVVGLSLLRFFPSGLPESLRSRPREPQKETRPPDVQVCRMARRDGSEAKVEVTAVPFLEDGEPACQLVIRDVTDREEAREKLRASQDSLVAILDGVGDFIMASDRDGRLVFANAAASHALGFFSLDEALTPSRQELMSRLEVLRPDGSPFPSEEMPVDRALLTRRPAGPTLSKWRRRGAAGNLGYRWSVARSVPILDGDGEVAMVITTLNDVSGLKRAQKALENSEARFRTLTEASLEAIAVLAGERIVDANRAMLETFGYSEEELRGRSILDLVHPDSREKMGRRREAGEGSIQEVQGLRKDGTRFPMEIRGRTSHDSSVRIESIRDLTERKRLEEERQRLFSLSNDLMSIAGLDGRFLQLNDSWERALGYSREEIAARPILEFVHPDDRERTRREMESLAGGNDTFNFENRFVARDGSVKWLSWGASVNLEQKRIYAVARDISERKQQEAALLRAKEAAEEASRAKGRFMANISHEIRTPMNGVVSMADLLAETPMDSKQRKFVKIIRTSARSLVRIIDDVLDFSKGEQGKLRLENRPFDLQETVADAIALLEGPAQEKGLDLRWTFSRGTPRTVTGDSGRLRQILVNLVGNAVKFTDKGRVELRIGPRAGRDGSPGLRFEVEDTGPGIDSGVAERLFQPFVQSDGSDTRRHGGAGLGLAICRQLAELMGGEIGFTSHPGKGSAFRADLPLPASADGGKEPAHAGLVPTAEFGSLRILVAEDNAINQVVIASLLERLGCVVELAADGRQALDACRRGDYDIVFMDCHMPELDGFTAAARIRLLERKRRKTPGVYISAMTADVLPSTRERCREAGMDGYLTKPIVLEDLIGMLERVRGKSPAGSFHAPSPRGTLEEGDARDLDARILDRLRLLSVAESPSLFDDLVKGFLREGRSKLAILQACARAGDYPALALAAHGFKGVCLNFGALSMARECEALQLAAARVSSGELAPVLERLAAAEVRTRGILEGMSGACAQASPSARGEGSTDG